MLSPSCQLLERNLDLFENQKWGVVNPDDSNVFSLSKDFQCGLHYDYRSYTSSQYFVDTQQTFSAHWQQSDVSEQLSGFIIFMPKVKQLLPMMLANVVHISEQNSKIIVVGENAGGIKSAKSIMENMLHNVVKADTARRCSLFIGITPKSAVHIEQPVFKKQIVNINGISLTTSSLPGVFGHKQLDPATKILLEQIPSDFAHKSMRTGYDFACGSGILGAYLSTLYPCLSMTYSDVDALALASTERTLYDNELKGDVAASDGFLKSANNLDIIVTNPPFHNKLKNDYAITQTFIRDAHERLNRNGVMYLVANKFLPYQESLKEKFSHVEVPYADNKFIVYVARKN